MNIQYYNGGLTIPELKALVKDLPDTDNEGNALKVEVITNQGAEPIVGSLVDSNGKLALKVELVRSQPDRRRTPRPQNSKR